MLNCSIMAIVVNHRTSKAPKLQEVLTTHGCAIKMRLGMHETNEKFCSDEGLILLQLCAEKNAVNALEKDLRALEGITVKTMEI
jgi:hypothetical protein